MHLQASSRRDLGAHPDGWAGRAVPRATRKLRAWREQTSPSKRRDTVIAAAVAVELIQIGSLVHDDIFDNAETRRGTPTINAVGHRHVPGF